MVCYQHNMFQRMRKDQSTTGETILAVLMYHSYQFINRNEHFVTSATEALKVANEVHSFWRAVKCCDGNRAKELLGTPRMHQTISTSVRSSIFILCHSRDEKR